MDCSLHTHRSQLLYSPWPQIPLHVTEMHEHHNSKSHTQISTCYLNRKGHDKQLTTVVKRPGERIAPNELTTRTATTVRDWARSRTGWPTHAPFFWSSPIKVQLKEHLHASSLTGAQKAFEQACLHVCRRSFVRNQQEEKALFSLSTALLFFLLILESYTDQVHW